MLMDLTLLSTTYNSWEWIVPAQVCFKIREQLPPDNPLVCCNICHWGWCCKQHFPQNLPRHSKFCQTYKALTEIRLYAYTHARDNDGQAVEFTPIGAVQQLAELPSSWQDYMELRKAPNFNPSFRK